MSISLRLFIQSENWANVQIANRIVRRSDISHESCSYNSLQHHLDSSYAFHRSVPLMTIHWSLPIFAFCELRFIGWISWWLPVLPRWLTKRASIRNFHCTGRHRRRISFAAEGWLDLWYLCILFPALLAELERRVGASILKIATENMHWIKKLAIHYHFSRFNTGKPLGIFYNIWASFCMTLISFQVKQNARIQVQWQREVKVWGCCRHLILGQWHRFIDRPSVRPSVGPSTFGPSVRSSVRPSVGVKLHVIYTSSKIRPRRTWC